MQEQSPDAETHTVCIDFSKADFREVMKVVDEACQGRDVALLVNNAGMGVVPTPLHELDGRYIDDTLDLIQVNVVAFTAVLRGVVPHLVARKHRGGIINVSSASSFIGLPPKTT